MAKLVIPAANTIIRNEGIKPALENAWGRVNTPPPQTVATKLKMAIAGDERLVSQSWAGTSSSSEGWRLSSSLSLGQKEDRRFIAANVFHARAANSGVDGIDLLRGLLC